MTLFWVVLLFAAGAALLLLEFVLPGLVMGLIGVGLIVASMAYGVLYVPEYAVFIVVGEIVGIMGVVALGMWLMTRTNGGGLALRTAMNAEEGWQNMATDASLLGQTGVVLTALRPAGVIEVEGRRLDVTSDGTFIEQGATVRVISVNGNYIVVERAAGDVE